MGWLDGEFLMSDFLRWVFSDPGRAHEAIWAFVGLALGFIAAVVVLVREVFHGIDMLRRAKEEHFPSKKPEVTLSPVDEPPPQRKTIIIKHIYDARGPATHNRRHPNATRQRAVVSNAPARP